jgi:uncharacterized membrane protein YcfT
MLNYMHNHKKVDKLEVAFHLVIPFIMLTIVAALGYYIVTLAQAIMTRY